MKSIKWFLIIPLFVLSAFAQAKTFTVKASTQSYNRLMFPVPYQKIVIPHNANLREKPIALQGNRGILIRPAPGANPINVFVQLVSGEAFTVRLVPSSNPKGAVFRFHGATDTMKPPKDVSRPDDGWLADVFVNVVQGKKPAGFEDGAALMPIRAVIAPGQAVTTQWEQVGTNARGQTIDADALNNILLTPIHHYIGSGYSVRVYRLSATQLVNVEPRDFYRKGQIAVAIDGDVVGPHQTPLMVVLEVKHGE